MSKPQESMKEKLQKRLLTAIDDITSAKFFVLVSSTLLLLAGKLNENNWIMLVMMIAGLKEAGALAVNLKAGTMQKGTKDGTDASNS